MVTSAEPTGYMTENDPLPNEWPGYLPTNGPFRKTLPYHDHRMHSSSSLHWTLSTSVEERKEKYGRSPDRICSLPLTPCQGTVRLCWLYTTSCRKLLNLAVPAKGQLQVSQDKHGACKAWTRQAPGLDKHLDWHQWMAPSNPFNRPAYQVWTHFVTLPLTSPIKGNPINSSRLQTAYLWRPSKHTHLLPPMHTPLSLSCSHK